MIVNTNLHHNSSHNRIYLLLWHICGMQDAAISKDSWYCQNRHWWAEPLRTEDQPTQWLCGPHAVDTNMDSTKHRRPLFGYFVWFVDGVFGFLSRMPPSLWQPGHSGSQARPQSKCLNATGCQAMIFFQGYLHKMPQFFTGHWSKQICKCFQMVGVCSIFDNNSRSYLWTCFPWKSWWFNLLQLFHWT